MHPDPFQARPGDDMEAASKREFFGPGGRRTPSGEPEVVPMQGNGIDRPVVPDPTNDHPLSTRHMDETAYRADPPTGVSRHPRGRDEDLIDNAGYDGDAPEQHNNLGEDPYPGRYASNE